MRAALGVSPKRPTRPASPLTFLPMSFHLPSSTGLTDEEAADFGELFAQAVDLARRDGHASVAILQESLGVSYCRAVRVHDALQRLGVIPPEIRPRTRAATWAAAPAT